MVFSSALFLIWFLPFFLGLYHLMDRKYKNYFTLAASALFYAWGGPVFIFVIFLTTTIDFILVRKMHEANEPSAKKRYLRLALCLNIGMLVVFKLSNFFMDTADGILEALGLESLGWIRFALPLGVSFYTFESITYIVDVYRGVHAPLKKFSDYQLYILYFPKLLAGPIVRYHEIADQIDGRFDTFSQEQFLTGFYRFVTGLSKKVLIANILGATASKILAENPETLSTFTAWTGTLAFGLQYYFDFSGYSDIAIGIGMMMGFRLPENFDNPVTSRNFQELWTRWHMSFSRFMKNYVYIPLGGNRLGEGRTLLNLLFIFILSGLWHGATWKCLIWGLCHGCLILFQRYFGSRIPFKVPGLLSIPATFISFSVLCLFLHPSTLAETGQYLYALLGRGNGTSLFVTDAEFWFTAALALVFALFILIPGGKKLQEFWFMTSGNDNQHIFKTVTCCILFVLCVSYVTWSPFNPFLYLRF